mgnify:CR=1 FL=1
MKQKKIFTVDHVFKSFAVGDQSVEVLKDVSFDINYGEMLVIFGPSGCGKSTLLHILLGLEPPSKGLVKFLNEDLYNRGDDDRAEIRKNHVGMVYQQPTWVKSHTVIQNVALPLIMLGKDSDLAKQEALKKLEIVGMQDWADYIPTELSSGQQQKVSVARALINDPDLLVADEPTGNLDTVSGEELMKLLEKLNQQGKTIIMVTHDLEYLGSATRIFYMLDGQIEKEFDKNIDQIDIQKLMKNGKKYGSSSQEKNDKNENYEEEL